MKPFSDSPQDGAPKPTPQSVEAEQRREAVERSRVERLLHAKSDGQISENESAELSRLASDHARFAGEVKRTRLALDHMSILPPAPDFTARVLDYCGDKDQFKTRPKRRSIRRDRLALAGCAVALIIGLVSTHRYWPGWTRSSARSEPLARVLSAGQKDLAESFSSLTNTSRLVSGEVSLRLAAVPQPAHTPTVAVARDTRLKLGNTSRFDKPLTNSVSSFALMASQSSGPAIRGWNGNDVICRNDLWFLASLSQPDFARSHPPAMSEIMAMSIPGPRAEKVKDVFPQEPESSDWPNWPSGD